MGKRIQLKHFSLMKSKMVYPQQIEKILMGVRKARPDQKVVFTNGCFDLLHVGHVDYLGKARDMGDLLIVGVNSDESVRRLKGSTRPIVDLRSRMAVLAALESVNFVTTPIELIRMLRPDILVKGGDYKRDTIVGADFVESYGGKVVTVPLVDGFSTTNIVEKMKS